MEYGIPFTITPDSGPAVAFNTVSETGAIYVVGDAQNFDAPALRQTIENRPGKGGGFIWPSVDSTLNPGLQGNIAAADASESFDMEQALRRLHRAMRRRWGTLSWVNSDGVTRSVRVTSVTLAITGSIPKSFLLQMVSDEPTKQGNTGTLTIAEGATETLANEGDMEAWCTGRLYGPWTACTLTNNESGEVLDLFGTAAIPADHYLEFDMLNETLYYDGDHTDYRGSYLSDIGDFFSVADGESDISFDSDNAGSAYIVWRDAWS